MAVSNRSVGGVNLLRSGAIRGLVMWRGFPTVLQLVTLFVIITLALIGWGLHVPEGVKDKLFAKSNIVNLVVWGIWWPLMVFAAVLLGRVWCTICPLELVSRLSERIRKCLGYPGLKLGKALHGGVLAFVAYFAVQMLVPGAHLHRIPAYTSVFLLSLLGSAVLVGFLYRDRAFCRGFCPLRLFFNAYSRGGTIAVRSTTPERRRKQDASPPVCPSLLSPLKLNDNSDCLVCATCLKSPVGKQIGLFARRPFTRDDCRQPTAGWSLTLFVMMLSGFVTSEIAGIGDYTKEIFNMPHEQATSALGLEYAAGWIEGIWTLVAFPLGLWTLLGLAAVATRHAHGIGDAWRRIALPGAFIIAGAHMTKAVEKLASWIPYLPHALEQPHGETALAITQGATAEPSSLLAKPEIAAVGLVLMAAATLIAVREAKLSDSRMRAVQAVPYLLLGGLFVWTILRWQA